MNKKWIRIIGLTNDFHVLKKLLKNLTDKNSKIYWTGTNILTDSIMNNLQKFSHNS